MISTIDTVRGRTVESRHAVSAAVVDADGKLVARAGDPDLVTYWRSCAKPIQVLPLLTDGAAETLGVADAEIAVACASQDRILRQCGGSVQTSTWRHSVGVTGISGCARPRCGAPI